MFVRVVHGHTQHNREGRNYMAVCVSKRTEYIHITYGLLKHTSYIYDNEFRLTHTVINIYQI